MATAEILGNGNRFTAEPPGTGEVDGVMRDSRFPEPVGDFRYDPSINNFVYVVPDLNAQH